MSNTNALLTLQIDGLLKSIEQEELEKSIRLLQEKEVTLSSSQKTLLSVSALAVLIALCFGVAFLGDINRSQRYRKKLEKSNQRINELLKSREKLMLSISHDIKAPVSSILGYIELSESTEDKTNREQYLSNMKSSGEHVLALVKKLLDYQKLESGEWVHKNVNYSLSEMFQEIATAFVPLAEKKGLQYTIDNQLPRKLITYGDPLTVREVLNNIISNAVKYIFEGEVTVAAHFVGKENKPLVRFTVTDTGLGMDKNESEKIFEEFVQLNCGAVVEGSGLGLAITKALVREMNGKISVVSEKGKGSEFAVELPVPILLPVPPDAGNEPQGNDAILLDNLTILVVDDDKLQLSMVAEMLRRRNIRVVTETNPNKALEILKTRSFDLIFIDMQMPEMNGCRLMEKIRSEKPDSIRNTPIVSLSANSELTKEDLSKFGFADFLNKPFTSKELYTVIRQHAVAKKSFAIDALIGQSRDDKAIALEILHSFVEVMSEDIVKLKNAIVADDLPAIAALAHKSYPVIAMMDEGMLTDLLLKMNKRETVTDAEKRFVLQSIENYIGQAEARIRELENQ